MSGSTYKIGADLGLALIDKKILFDAISEGIESGSYLRRVSWKDFVFAVNHGTDLARITNVELAVKAGMLYLDAIFYFHALNRPEDVQIIVRDENDSVQYNALTVSKGLFCWYFSIYSQGRAKGIGSNNFLTSVLGLGANWMNLVDGLTSANINVFPVDWAPKVRMISLSEPARNRIALGAAGQRLIQALNYIRPNDFKEGTEEGKRFIQALKDWTKGKVYWDLHPITKNQNIITITKSLNKSIIDCLAVSLTEAAKERLVGSKVIHATPIEQPSHGQWRDFDPKHLPPLEEPIFGTVE